MTSDDPDPYEDDLSMTSAEFKDALDRAIMSDEYKEFIMVHSTLCDFMDLEMSSNQLETIHDKPFGVNELLGETRILLDEGGAMTEVGFRTYLSYKEGEAHLVANKAWGEHLPLTGKRDKQDNSCDIMMEVLAELRKNKKAPKDDSFTAITWACNLKFEENELRGKEFSRHWNEIMNEGEIKFLVDLYPKRGGPSKEHYMLKMGHIGKTMDNDLLAKHWYARKKEAET